MENASLGYGERVHTLVRNKTLNSACASAEAHGAAHPTSFTNGRYLELVWQEYWVQTGVSKKWIIYWESFDGASYHDGQDSAFVMTCCDKQVRLKVQNTTGTLWQAYLDANDDGSYSTWGPTFDLKYSAVHVTGETGRRAGAQTDCYDHQYDLLKLSSDHTTWLPWADGQEWTTFGQDSTHKHMTNCSYRKLADDDYEVVRTS